MVWAVRKGRLNSITSPLVASKNRKNSVHLSTELWVGELSFGKWECKEEILKYLQFGTGMFSSDWISKWKLDRVSERGEDWAPASVLTIVNNFGYLGSIINQQCHPSYPTQNQSYQQCYVGLCRQLKIKWPIQGICGYIGIVQIPAATLARSGWMRALKDQVEKVYPIGAYLSTRSLDASKWGLKCDLIDFQTATLTILVWQQLSHLTCL